MSAENQSPMREQLQSSSEELDALYDQTDTVFRVYRDRAVVTPSNTSNCLSLVETVTLPALNGRYVELSRERFARGDDPTQINYGAPLTVETNEGKNILATWVSIRAYERGHSGTETTILCDLDVASSGNDENGNPISSQSFNNFVQTGDSQNGVSKLVADSLKTYMDWAMIAQLRRAVSV